jgi:UPF0755 protein
MNPFLRFVIITFFVLALGAAYLYYHFHSRTMVPPNLEDYYLHIPTNSNFDEVVDLLKTKGVVRDEAIFRRLAAYMKYQREPMRAGRYKVEPGWNIVRLVRHLRNGEQAAVNVALTNERLPENVAAKAARYLESDSIDFVALFEDSGALHQLGYTPETLMSLFIPNTYEFLWNTSPAGFLERMKREHDAFWNKNGRREKAQTLGLSPAEVYTLASIVEKETLVEAEKPRMAGVYLNRLRIGMRLQADPTSVFARRDFGATRVTDYHTKFDSPYNTYLYKGLPPGPIGMTSVSSIDAVLNPESHDYFYFCAIGDGSGLHAFARTLEAHNENARRYRENLRKRGLR